MRAWRAVLAALALAVLAGAAHAQLPRWPDALAGRLAHIKATGVVHVGYRADAIPFSYAGAGGAPVGYSIDLCRAIVEEIATELGATPGIAFVAVTAADRIDRVAAGEVDFECGSTTNTAERRRKVAFSPAIFVTGTRIAVPRGSAVRSFRDLRGRTVGVVAGTTNEAAMRELDRRNGLGATIVAVADYREALELLVSRKADALAADDVLLRGVLAETGRAREVRLVGEMLALEAYGIVYARDDAALGAIVERTLRRLAETGEITWTYNRWFVRRLPSGQRLDLPMGVELRRAFELMGLPPE